MISAACHVHSEWSYDAKWTLRDLAGEFAGRGYQVLMVTDHDRGFSESRRMEHRAACAEASSEKILVVPGIEYSDADNIVHTLVWGPVPFLGEGMPTLEVLKGVRAVNGVAVMAHPSRREAWKRFDPSWADYLLGMEVWNRKADGWAPSPVAQQLIAGTSLVPFACLDFHASNQMFPLAMELEISTLVTEESVLNSLRARRCRAMAFSGPAEDVLKGWPRLALRPAEGFRRTAAQVLRWLKKR